MGGSAGRKGDRLSHAAGRRLCRPAACGPGWVGAGLNAVGGSHAEEAAYLVDDEILVGLVEAGV